MRCRASGHRIMPSAKSATGSALRMTLSTGILRALAAAKIDVLQTAAAGQDQLEAFGAFPISARWHRVEMHQKDVCIRRLLRPVHRRKGRPLGRPRSSLSCRAVNSCLSVDRPTSASVISPQQSALRCGRPAPWFRAKRTRRPPTTTFCGRKVKSFIWSPFPKYDSRRCKMQQRPIS